jgi:hypothetical protein
MTVIATGVWLHAAQRLLRDEGEEGVTAAFTEAFLRILVLVV